MVPNNTIVNDVKKMHKQMNYADKRTIPYVVIAGGNEIESKTFTLKNLKTGEQEVVKMDGQLEKLKG